MKEVSVPEENTDARELVFVFGAVAPMADSLPSVLLPAENENRDEVLFFSMVRLPKLPSVPKATAIAKLVLVRNFITAISVAAAALLRLTVDAIILSSVPSNRSAFRLFMRDVFSRGA